MMAVSRRAQAREDNTFYFGDQWLVAASALLLATGLVMMSSASVEIAWNQYGDAFYFLKRQLRFLVLGLIAALVVLVTPMQWWRRGAWALFLAANGLLILVLIPGIGREVNGSARWLDLGFMTIQAS